MPALGMALTVTVVSTYLPVLVEQVSTPLAVGLLIGGEGFFGLFMPALVGAWSDRRARRARDRVPMLVVFAAVVAGASVAVGAVATWSDGSLAAYAVALAILYLGYYAFLAPYWALYPDLVPPEQSGRSRSAEGTWRVAGTGLALVAGGLLFDLSPGLPFLAAGGVVVVCVAVMLRGVRHRLDHEVAGDDDGTSGGAVRALLADRAVRRLCVATALWNFALSSLRAFVVLFFTVGIDRSSSFVATVVFPLVAVGIAVGAPFAGWAADRWGHVRIVGLALVVYGTAMALPGFTQAWLVFAIIPFVALGAAAVMTLDLAILMRLVPRGRHGAASGLFGFSRGVGATTGPVLTGAAVMLLAPVFPDTEGYAAMWLLSSAALLLSLVPLVFLRHDGRLAGSSSRAG